MDIEWEKTGSSLGRPIRIPACLSMGSSDIELGWWGENLRSQNCRGLKQLRIEQSANDRASLVQSSNYSSSLLWSGRTCSHNCSTEEEGTQTLCLQPCFSFSCNFKKRDLFSFFLYLCPHFPSSSFHRFPLRQMSGLFKNFSLCWLSVACVFLHFATEQNCPFRSLKNDFSDLLG